MMTSMVSYTIMARGMPAGRQDAVALPSSEPAARLARISSSSAWYSVVSGGCCPRPPGLSGSKLALPMRVHWARISGYFVRSCADAPAIVMPNAATSASAPTAWALALVAFRSGIVVSAFSRRVSGVDPFTRRTVLPILSLLRLIEIAQIGRRLILFGGHQLAIGAQEIG